MDAFRITKDDYDKKLKELKEKQYEIGIQIEEHTRADENYYITASNVLNIAKNAKDLFESSEIPEKRAILNYLLQNYTVNEKTPCITMRSPFNEILSLTKTVSKLTWWDNFRTYKWEEAFPDPNVAVKQINHLLQLV